MVVICRRCLDALRSRGERVCDRPIDYYDREDNPDWFVDDDDHVLCDWCGELFETDECVAADFC